MKEQSHKQEMDAAVRGDFARLRARGVTTTIAADDESMDSETASADVAGDGPQRTEPAVQSPLRRLFRRG